MKKEPLIVLLQHTYDLDKKTAEALILAGRVLVDEQKITKAGQKVSPEGVIRIKASRSFVSRGAVKLDTTLTGLGVQVAGKICLDIGSSTGGFTQVLLKQGAAKVYAVDSGTNQLDYSLRIDPRVVSLENCRIQDVAPDTLLPPPELAVMDVSFTSCLPVVQHITSQLDIIEMVLLVKPQFEYKRLAKQLKLDEHFNGVIEDEHIAELIVDQVKKEFEHMNITLLNSIKSPIKGTKGNREYFVYCRK